VRRPGVTTSAVPAAAHDSHLLDAVDAANLSVRGIPLTARLGTCAYRSTTGGTGGAAACSYRNRHTAKPRLCARAHRSVTLPMVEVREDFLSGGLHGRTQYLCTTQLSPFQGCTNKWNFVFRDGPLAAGTIVSPRAYLVVGSLESVRIAMKQLDDLWRLGEIPYRAEMPQRPRNQADNTVQRSPKSSRIWLHAQKHLLRNHVLLGSTRSSPRFETPMECERVIRGADGGPALSISVRERAVPKTTKPR